MVTKDFIKFLFKISFLYKKSYLFSFILLLFLFFLSELSFILGFPEISKLLNSLSSNTDVRFHLNLYLFEINNIFGYLSIFLINFILKIIILKVSVQYGALITKQISSIYFDRYINELHKIEKHDFFDEFRSDLTIRLEILYSHFLLPSLTILFSIVAILSGAVALLFIDFNLTLLSCFIFICSYGIFFKISKKQLLYNDKTIKDSSYKLTNIIDNLLKDYKGLLINKDLAFLKKNFNVHNYELKKSYGLNYFLGHLPKYIIETTGFIFIILFAYLSSNQFMSNEYFSFLISFGLASIRILPIFQRFYSSITTIFGSYNTWSKILRVIDNNIISKENNKKLDLKKLIIQNINYKIIKKDNEQYLFSNLNLDFKIGNVYLIRGKSGQGKTSLLDIIVGIKKPDTAEFYINDQLFNNRIYENVPCYYLSQDASLPNGYFMEWFDRTAINNDSKINEINELFYKNDVLKYLPEDIKSWYISDNARNLSVGQRQRIFILRAVWKKCKLIILDEPTSGMDKTNEIKFFNLIQKLLSNSIVIIATHSLELKPGPKVKLIELN